MGLYALHMNLTDKVSNKYVLLKSSFLAVSLYCRYILTTAVNLEVPPVHTGEHGLTLSPSSLSPYESKGTEWQETPSSPVALIQKGNVIEIGDTKTEKPIGWKVFSRKEKIIYITGMLIYTTLIIIGMVIVAHKYDSLGGCILLACMWIFCCCKECIFSPCN